jgi:hypothetical protein
LCPVTSVNAVQAFCISMMFDVFVGKLTLGDLV